MEILAGLFYAAATLVAAAGVVKLVRPAAAAGALRSLGVPAPGAVTRLIGGGEVGVAALAVAGGRWGAALLSAAFVAFALFNVAAARRGAGCGCFGEASAPAGAEHVAIDAALAAVAGAVAVSPLPGPAELFSDEPVWGAAVVVLAAVTAYLLYLAMTAFADLRRVMRPAA